MGVYRFVANGWILVALSIGACSAPDPVGLPASKPLATPTVVGSATSAPPEPSASTTPRPTVAVTSTPGVSTTRALPAAARAHTSKGAETFARYYLEQVNKSWMAPDPSLLTGLASPSCETCANFLSTARSLHADGSHYALAPISVGDSILLPESLPNLMAFHFIYVQKRNNILDTREKVIKSLKRVPALTEITLSWSSKGWLLNEIAIVDAS